VDGDGLWVYEGHDLLDGVSSLRVDHDHDCELAVGHADAHSIDGRVALVGMVRNTHQKPCQATVGFLKLPPRAIRTPHHDQFGVAEQRPKRCLVLIYMVREQHAEDALTICESAPELVLMSSAVHVESVEVREVMRLGHLVSVGGSVPNLPSAERHVGARPGLVVGSIVGRGWDARFGLRSGERRP